MCSDKQTELQTPVVLSDQCSRVEVTAYLTLFKFCNKKHTKKPKICLGSDIYMILKIDSADLGIMIGAYNMTNNLH